MRTACHTVRAPRASATELRKEAKIGEYLRGLTAMSEIKLSNNDWIGTSFPAYTPQINFYFTISIKSINENASTWAKNKLCGKEGEYVCITNKKMFFIS